MSLSFGKIVSQLDLALDHLAQSDEDSARFALMLVDNVVELALHGHARYANTLKFFDVDDYKADESLVQNALRIFFQDKIDLAKENGMISTETANSIRDLHGMRNLAYHQGISYAETIRSLTIFYFEIACALLQKRGISLRREEKIPYRMAKYFNPNNPDENAIWGQLMKAADALQSDLLGDLVHGMTHTIQSIDQMIEFCATHSTPKMTRSDVVKNSQIEFFVFSSEGKKSLNDFCAKQRKAASEKDIENLMRKTMRKAGEQMFSADPVPKWMEKLHSLKAKKDRHSAVKIYCDFMEKTASIREKIDIFDFGLKVQLQQKG